MNDNVFVNVKVRYVFGLSREIKFTILLKNTYFAEHQWMGTSRLDYEFKVILKVVYTEAATGGVL